MGNGGGTLNNIVPPDIHRTPNLEISCHGIIIFYISLIGSPSSVHRWVYYLLVCHIRHFPGVVLIHLHPFN